MLARPLRAVLLLALLSAPAGGCSGGFGGPTSEGHPLVGAYYYTWYDPAEWKKGYLGQKLVPPVRPVLGEYASADPRVAEQHIRWAAEHGIDFFTVSWIGRDTPPDRHLRTGLLAAPNLDDIRFAILYESLLRLPTVQQRVHFDDATIERFVADVDYLATRYFSHPRYLRIAGRPVLFLYVTRNFEGKRHEAIAAVRRRLDRAGQGVYLVGDEMFWHEPRRRRIRLFDAVTGYNMYDWPRVQFAGYAADSAFLSEVTAQYRRYRLGAAAEGVAFAPAVVPGFNDRGVRLAEDHYVIPRRMTPDGADDTLFARTLREAGLGFLDPRQELLLITSFNEWHEWTQIEPTEPGPPTIRDTSGTGRFTMNLLHEGYGLRYLELLRDAVVSLSGRVVAGVERRPVPNVEVRVFRGPEPVARARTNTAGHFRFSRRTLPPGAYALAVGRQDGRRAVQVGESWTGPLELTLHPP